MIVRSYESFVLEEEKIHELKADIDSQDIAGVSLMLKAIGDENRAKITYALCQQPELCVCDIANVIGATVANASHHLRTLYKHGIVKIRKEGKHAHYSIDDDHIKQIMTIALIHRKEVVDNE